MNIERANQVDRERAERGVSVSIQSQSQSVVED
jgi:hypothetical protein